MRLADWRKRAFEGSDADYIRFQLFHWKFKPLPYSEWADMVEVAIGEVMSGIASRKAVLKEGSEDSLTATLCIGLEGYGFQARSANWNGNCDLTVTYGDSCVWLGEAKIFTGAAHVWGGYLQLVSRYADGLPEHSRVGMLLYCKKENALALLGEWQAYLDVMVANAQCAATTHPLVFTSADVAAATGLPLSVTHYAFPLFHEPLEDVVKGTAEAFAAGQAAKKAIKEGAASPPES